MPFIYNTMANTCCTKYAVSNFKRTNDTKGVPKLRNWSRDLNHAPVWVKFSYSDKGLHAVYYPKKLECAALSSRKLWRVPHLKFTSRVPDHVRVSGQFVVHWLVHVMVNVCIK